MVTDTGHQHLQQVHLILVISTEVGLMDTRCRARYLWISRGIKVVVHIYYSRYLFKGLECPNGLNLKKQQWQKVSTNYCRWRILCCGWPGWSQSDLETRILTIARQTADQRRSQGFKLIWAEPQNSRDEGEERRVLSRMGCQHQRGAHFNTTASQPLGGNNIFVKNYLLPTFN